MRGTTLAADKTNAWLGPFAHFGGQAFRDPETRARSKRSIWHDRERGVCACVCIGAWLGVVQLPVVHGSVWGKPPQPRHKWHHKHQCPSCGPVRPHAPRVDQAGRQGRAGQGCGHRGTWLAAGQWCGRTRPAPAAPAKGWLGPWPASCSRPVAVEPPRACRTRYNHGLALLGVRADLACGHTNAATGNGVVRRIGRMPRPVRAEW